MTSKVLLKDKTGSFIDELKTKRTVVAPVKKGDGPLHFVELEAGMDPALDGSQMTMPPKEYILPKWEKLMEIETTPGEEKVEETLPEAKPRAIVGMWLPDAEAIKVLDKVFMEFVYKDPYYAARREDNILIAVVPAKIRWSWFCASVDDVETWKQNVDVIMYDLGDKYFVESTSEKGEEITLLASMQEASESDTGAKEALWEEFKKQTTYDFAGKKLYDNLQWESPVWQEIGEKCLACGACSYMCPSCSCFDIQDEKHGSKVMRYRCRDGCQFEDFTLMGHGHNPRTNQVPRSRQRLLHKFKYQNEQFGIVACTGCGRCVELCPVNVDIRDILTRVCSEERKDEAETAAQS